MAKLLKVALAATNIAQTSILSFALLVLWSLVVGYCNRVMSLTPSKCSYCLYYRDLKAKNARQYRNACRVETDVENTKASSRKKPSPLIIVSQLDVEEFLVFVEVTTEFKITLCDSMKDFAETVAMVTKAVAEAPFK